MTKPASGRLATATLVFAATLGVAVIVVLFSRPPWFYHNPWLHASLEGFSQIIGLILAALALGMYYYEGRRRDLLLALAFVAAAAFDLPHALSYPGVLPLVHLRQDMSAYFWLAGRLTLAALLLASSLATAQDPVSRRLSRIAWGLGGTLGAVVVAASLLLHFQHLLPLLVGATGWMPSHLPAILGGNAALTPLKVILEGVAAVTFLLALMFFLRHYVQTGELLPGWLALALVPIVYSEVLFMVYPTVYGATWYLGHFLKIAAYLVLAVWLPVASVGLQAALTRERNELLSAYREIGELLTAKPNLDALLQVVLSAAVRMTHAQSGLVELGEGTVLCTAGCKEPCGRGQCAEMLVEAKRNPGGELQLWHDEHRLAAIVPLGADGEQLGFICVWRTVQAPFTRDELNMLVPFASQAALAVKQARMHQQRVEDQERREQFLVIATHEIKTPITSIKGYTQHIVRLLARLTHGDGDDEAMAAALQDSAAIIVRQADRMSRLVDEVMDWNRLRAGTLTLHRARFALNDWLPAALSQLALAYPERSLKHTLCPEPLPVEADEDRLTQVLANLVANAVNYSEEPSPVEITLSRQGEMALLGVHDCGPGISEQEIEAIFHPFYRAESSQAYYRQGIGLGLHVSREIMRGHGGDITVTSRPGEGSTFIISLPLAGPTSSGQKTRSASP